LSAPVRRTPTFVTWTLALWSTRFSRPKLLSVWKQCYRLSEKRLRRRRRSRYYGILLWV
jgi:hypothetical protein